jgi:hypothetical protein
MPTRALENRALRHAADLVLESYAQTWYGSSGAGYRKTSKQIQLDGVAARAVCKVLADYVFEEWMTPDGLYMDLLENLVLTRRLHPTPDGYRTSHDVYTHGWAKWPVRANPNAG